ncbi:Peptidoglycan-binding domain 1 protein [Ktedonobacter racemifer DSM 44963]|uniref:Peptidoglycan-binding domain 1 protein n=1 Tax=Ktedonobacter racemifer DSM 44963 TaxID=485913 RepID=D6TPF0_KTERA|nr:Peptidoglycan-binding domain 1 protein [Ktedonobacter racemifer DSM 44963]
MCDHQNPPQKKPLPSKESHNRRTVLKLGAGAMALAGLGGFEVVLTSSTAHAAPSIIGDATWGARAATDTITVFNRKPTAILIHHTASPNTTDYSLNQAYQLARSIQTSHLNNGWIDTGQHFTVTRGGYVLEGRHRSLATLQGGTSFVQGTHCPVMNDSAIGIEDEGTYTSVLPPDALWNSLVDLCTYICQQYGLNANNIFGHRDFYDTECPGTQFYGRLPALRHAVASRLNKPLPAYTWPTLKSRTSGNNVRTIQRLLQVRGYSVAVDGTFGPSTVSSIQSFQSTKGLSVNGIVAQQTWEALITTVTPGSSSAAVSAVQNLLSARGYSVSVTGYYGSATASAVKSYQSSRGLTADGTVEKGTWCALVGGVLG